MIKSFRVKRFRCFGNLEVVPLSRINLFSGRNNAGKTALLEALFLHMGSYNPQLPIIVTGLRGLEQSSPDFQELLGWMFIERDINQSIEFTSRCDGGQERKTEIRLVDTGKTSLVPGPGFDVTNAPAQGIRTGANGPRELQIRFDDNAGLKGISRAWITAHQIKFETSEVHLFPQSELMTTRARSQKQDPERFSKLEQEGGQRDLVEALRLLEPRLKRLAVLVTGGIPIVHGDIGSRQLIPVPFMGEGFARLLSILLAISGNPGGAVLVDEIETGIHHSVMIRLWEAINKASASAGVQFFATTHSYECIRAANEAFKSSDGGILQLHRLERVRDQITSVTYDRQSLETAISSELEIR